jgi:hypothetical protein
MLTTARDLQIRFLTFREILVKESEQAITSIISPSLVEPTVSTLLWLVPAVVAGTYLQRLTTQ